MRRKRFLKFLLLFIVVAPILVFAIGEAILHLWNWLLPPLFGWHTITFWQAIALLVLCRILFGRFGSGGHGRHPGHWRHRMKERFQHMSPQEKEEMFRRWVGGFEPPAAQADAKS
jgi:hypothetical protein